MNGYLSVAETVVFGGVLLACLVAVPVLARHVTGRTEAIDEAVGLMAGSDKYRRRLAGGMHLTWGVLLFASLGVLAGGLDLDAVRAVAGTVFLVLVLGDMAVFFFGRPKVLMLPRYRSAAPGGSPS